MANRLPVSVTINDGNVDFSKSSGGLATGFDSLDTDIEKHWVGWPGTDTTDPKIQSDISQKLEAEHIHPLFLTAEDIELFYEGFSNNTLWPLFHYFTRYVEYNQQTWERYVEVNRKFHEAVLKIAQPNDIIWVQDYHLMLLPAMLRADLPNSEIGYFLHIPFPSYELFRTLPWRKEILEGLLGADQIGFHTHEYMRHFISSVSRITDYENQLGELYLPGRTVKVDAYPMGICYEKFHGACDDPAVQEQMKRLQDSFKDTRIVLSVDRLDYSKGILQRLHACNHFLENNPEMAGKVVFLMLVVPSRDNVEHYALLKEEIDELIGKINGRHATMHWSPLHYYYRSLPFEELAALYKISDVCLVTSLRDGMNLVSKEYIASRKKDGVLILSEMAGAFKELKDSVCINPNNVNEISEAIKTALEMKPDEQLLRLLKMQRQVKKYSVQFWANDFIDQMSKRHEEHLLQSERLVAGELRDRLVSQYASAKKRLILLDYDGTLVPFSNDPNEAFPDELLLELLKDLSVMEHTKVVLISGRRHDTLSEWFKDIEMDLIAEHGMWTRTASGWQETEKRELKWKPEVKAILDEFTGKTRGSFVEEKDSGLAWHYRNCDSWIADIRAQQIMKALVNYCTRNGLEILDGRKVIEIKNNTTNKGIAAQQWLSDSPDFVMALGDDQTDEDVFRAIPEGSWGIKVGNLRTIAPYRLSDYNQVRDLLHKMIIATNNGDREQKRKPEKETSQV